MKRRLAGRRVGPALWAVAMVTACGGGSVVASGPPGTSVGSTTAPAPVGDLVSCASDGSNPFPEPALHGSTGAEQADSPAAAAFRAFLDAGGTPTDPVVPGQVPPSTSTPVGGPPSTTIPDDLVAPVPPSSSASAADVPLATMPGGSASEVPLSVPPTTIPTDWRLLVDDGTSALFAAGDPPLVQTVAFHNDHGTWRFARSGVCGGVYVVRPGRTVAHWGLDPQQLPNPASTEVLVRVSETACSSGRALTPELIGAPEVTQDADRVVITVTIEAPQGAQKCPGISDGGTPVTVTLDQPLGSRRLLDGGMVPPAPAFVPIAKAIN